ncbi:hypothetical protein GF327_01035 [Candidatus Woesearchaeota archaeon]|nr:hypothetical protein [Candidatus Woesearchaeota archaeon]
MKILVVYYSRTGKTEEVAKKISKRLKADIEKIIDKKSRKGILGYISGGKDAATRKLTKIGKIKNDPEKYDLVIIGTPVWARTMAPAIRTYLTKNKLKKKVAFFCTCGSYGIEKTFRHMRELTNHAEYVAGIGLTSKDLNYDYSDKIEMFTESLT